MTATEQIGNFDCVFIVFLPFKYFHSLNFNHRRITVYPKGVDPESKDFMSVFFYLDNNRPNFCAFKLSIVDESGSEKYTQNDNLVCSAKSPSGGGWYEFISRDDLFKKENLLIKDNTLILSGKFEFVKESKFVQTASKSEEFDKLYDLFKKRSFSDFEIHIQGKSIKAHKILLAANSPMFAELVENQNYLRLHDFEFEVAEEMINFIYDGKVSDMGRFAKPLLKAADKFEINRLKVYCEKYLYENLCTLNAIETLKLSAKCHAEELKDECIDFIQK
jgi:speckle-type POZ protein